MTHKEKPLGFGIIGLGSIAGHHIKSIVELDSCKLVAISSRNRSKLQSAAAQYYVEAFTDYQKLTEHPDVDVVCICTPSGFHLEPALVAAGAGKHVITEKPLEISVERGLKMIEACEKAGVKLACIFQNRYSPDYRQLYEAVKIFSDVFGIQKETSGMKWVNGLKTGVFGLLQNLEILK